MGDDDDQDQQETRDTSKDEALLKEIRDTYRSFKAYWEDARKERSIDLRYLSGDPWEPEDRKARKHSSRPCINQDELNQYVHAQINNLRQNKRGIKVDPWGNGATDKTAEFRQDKIRTIEYRSKAQGVYLKAAQDMYEGSYGFFRIGRKYIQDDPDTTDPHWLDQEIAISPIPNPDSVLYDPNCKEPDWSDARKVFILDPIPRDEFKERYPKAQKTSFSNEDMVTARDWIQDKVVIVAEYWKLIVTISKKSKGKKSRETTSKKVVQYITNGLEILDEIEQPGTEIPIPAMIGLERYREENGGSVKRELYSLPRVARNPQMMIAYLASQEAEEAGMAPKVPVIGYTGQFDTDQEAWENINKEPRTYLQVDPVPDPMNPNQVLPLPQWRQFVPNFQAYEMAIDGKRRAVQAAMGIASLPTAAQRDNEKSGIALERIDTQEAIGSYHFVQGFERAVERAGRIIDSWMPIVYDNEREMWLHKADDTRRKVTANTDQPYLNEKTGRQEHYPIGDEQHDIGISTGPSFESQRQAVSDFLDNLIANLPKMPVPPPAAAKLLAMAIEMKNLGPKGDQMAQIIAPETPDQSGQLQQMQQAAQQQGQVLQAMQGELQKLQLEKAGHVIDNQFKLQIEKMREENSLAIAEVNTKAQALSERLQTFSDMMAQFHDQAHDVALQGQQQQHEAAQADQQRQAAAEQQQIQAQQQQQQPQQPNQGAPQ